MKLLAVLKWVLIFALAVVIAVGAGAFWLWQNSNGMLRQKVLQAFEKVAPDLELHLDGIQLLSTTSVKLTGVEVRDRSSHRPILRAVELRAVVDEAQLMERQQVLVKSVRVSGVDILLRRHSDGRWNWQDYHFVKQDEKPFIPPSLILENVRAQIQLEHGEGIPPASLIVSTPLFQAIPGSGDQYDFTGLVSLPGAGNLAVNGDCDLKRNLWKLGGRLTGVSADQNLLELAKSTAPQLAERLQQLDAAMVGVLPGPTPAQTASASKDSAALVIGASGVAPRFLGILDVDFSVEKTAGNSIPDLRLKVDIRDGRLSSPVIPIRLTDVRAKFFWDNSNVILQLLNARDGDALITGDFSMQLGESTTPPEAHVHLQDFPISAELRPLVPPQSQKFIDHFQPVGKVSGDITLRRSPSGKWLPVSVTGTAENASVLFHRFRYPVSGITAKMTQRPISDSANSLSEAIFDVVANGMMGTRPVTAVGWIRNPGPEIELRFDLHVDDFAMDSRFRDALDEQGRKVIDSLNISGLTSADVACYRPPGPEQPIGLTVKANVHDARMQFRSFPYEIDRLSGTVEFRSKEKSWTFTDLHGWHGPGELRAFGTFRGLPAPGELSLTVQAKDAKLDADLFHSLNESSRSLWTMVNPEGKVNLTTQIAWTAAAGHKPVVRLDGVEIFDATICPAPFPYRMNIRSAKVSYDPNDPRAAGMQHCEIHSLVAEHDGSLITASGWAEAGNDGFWQLHLNDLNAMNLKPDDSLRAALPASWRETLSRMAQAGRVSVEASELEFRGVTKDEAPTTAAWKMNLRLKDCEVAAGLNLKKVSGLVKAGGTWDGYRLKNQGTIRLDQVEVLEMTIAGVNGPYSMTEEELVLGSRDVILGLVRPVDVSPEDRIQAQAYGGSLEMDGLIDLAAGSNYRFFGELKNALLEIYAARHVPDQPNLKGVVNSWIFVAGDGDSAANLKGKGQLQINPAALYEVPVVLEMFSALSRLNFAVPNRTAFDYALMSFQIHDQAFWFDPIDLVGDALALRGRGSVGFGGDVVLDFFSRPARPRGPRIPFSGLLMSSATQWVNVQVRGTINRPQTTVGSKMQLDESMRQFLSTFEPRPDGPIPSLTIPNVFGIPTAPQARRP
jgi:hypothetical protein